jgi:cytochrome c551/c552
MPNLFRSGRIWLFIAIVTASGVVFPQLAAKGHSHDEKHGKRRDEPPLQPLTDEQIHHAESLVATICSACHGPHLEGKVGPSLQGVDQRYSFEKIERIIRFGKGKQKQVPMPAGLVSDADATLLAHWLIQHPASGNTQSQ